MKQRWIGLILALLTLLPMMTGCWSRKELNDLALVLALGIDKHDQGYEVSVQVLNPGEAGNRQGNGSGGGGGLPVITYQATGKTVPDALQRMHSMAPRRLYLAHIRVLVFGEEMARAGIGNALDFIARNHELRTDFFLLVAKGERAADILKVVTQFEPIPANALYSSILIAHDSWATTGKVTLQRFITEFKRDGSQPVLSAVRVKGKIEEGQSLDNTNKAQPDTLMQHIGLAVFQQDRLVGWLDEAASKSVNYILNQVGVTEGYVDDPEGGRVGFRVNRSHCDLTVHLQPNGLPAFRAKLDLEMDLSTVPGNVDLSSAEDIARIEGRIENKYNANTGKYIHYVQTEYGTDIFGFGEVLHREYPQTWKKLREDWPAYFKQVDVQVESDATVRKIGSITQPIERTVETR